MLVCAPYNTTAAALMSKHLVRGKPTAEGMDNRQPALRMLTSLLVSVRTHIISACIAVEASITRKGTSTSARTAALDMLSEYATSLARPLPVVG